MAAVRRGGIGPPTKWRFVLALALASLLLAVVVGEIVLRASCSYCDWSERNGGSYSSHYETPFDSWYHAHASNLVRTFGQPEFDYEFATNSLGIRDLEHPLDADENEFRIVGLGDSFTEGSGAELEDSYLKVLERNLDERSVGKVRVISGGVAGSDPLYGFVLLRDKLLQFDPDLVLVTINATDVSDLMVRGGFERFAPDGGLRFNPRPTVEKLYRWSHLHRFVMMRLFGYDWFGLSPERQVERRARALEDLVAATDALQDLADRSDFELLVVLHPMHFELVMRSYNFDVGLLMEHMSSRRIRFVDLMDFFAARVRKEEVASLYWALDGHHNAAGYRLLAEGLEERIRDLGLLEEQP